MILVGDVGGTNTRLARARPVGDGYDLDAIAIYPSTSAPAFEPILRRYLDEFPGEIRAAGFGFPGPVKDFAVRTLNIPWLVDGRELERSLGVPVVLCNDLEAAAHGLLVLDEGATETLREGTGTGGNRALIAPGTGLGEGMLVGADGVWTAVASEGGHCDFAPRDAEEMELWTFLRARFGRVSYERIVSGPGLVNLYDFYAARLGVREPPWEEGHDPAAAVTRAAIDGTCAACVRALDRFCSVYGAEAGNIALKVLALGGVYLAGGITPKILPVLKQSRFFEAFDDKGRYRGLMQEMPLRAVLDPNLALRGAARAAVVGRRVRP
ncbi:MAG: glucokinase [Acidobacteria bacterium]|nr:glucokinase [Acidobacteriota bacterium]